MRTRELKAIEAARPQSPVRKREPMDRARQIHNEVVGEFRNLGVVDLEDPVRAARGERRIL